MVDTTVYKIVDVIVIGLLEMLLRMIQTRTVPDVSVIVVVVEHIMHNVCAIVLIVKMEELVLLLPIVNVIVPEIGK
jgi:hypothetical protein